MSIDQCKICEDFIDTDEFQLYRNLDQFSLDVAEFIASPLKMVKTNIVNAQCCDHCMEVYGLNEIGDQ